MTCTNARSPSFDAVVTDEHRHTVGMVTMEDVLEAIVGDIIDESDQE